MWMMKTDMANVKTMTMMMVTMVSIPKMEIIGWIMKLEMRLFSNMLMGVMMVMVMIRMTAVNDDAET